MPSLFNKLVATCIGILALGAGTAAACNDFSRAPSSRWTIEHSPAASLLRTPCGDPFFSLGVNAVDGGARWRRDGDRVAYHWPSFAPTLRDWAETARGRLLGWGFNTAGAWSVPPPELDMPATPVLELGRRIQFVWDDPFDPQTQLKLARAARDEVAPFRGDPRRIGYFSDNEIGWWNGPLFLAFMEFPPTSYTKRRLVALLREHYAENWFAFVRDFVVPPGVQGFSDLLDSRSAPRLRPGGKGIAAVRAWTRTLADHYYRSMGDAIRAADPDALFLGDRLPIYYDADAVRAMVPHVDAISVNYNIDAPDGWIAPFFFDGLRELSGAMPVLVSEWFFAAHENRSGNLNQTGNPRSGDAPISNNRNRTGHLMTVATQAERARGAAAAARYLAARPEVIGVHWFQYADEPRGGRDDGEDYNFGLVDIDDRPYELLTHALAAENLARLAEPPGKVTDPVVPAAMHEVPRAVIDAADQSLAEWPKSSAILPLRPAPGEAVFGNALLTWSERGLSVAVLAMDYYDPGLLAFDGQFPAGESFRVDLGVDAGAGPRSFQIRVVPSSVTRSPKLRETKLGFSIELCARDEENCAPVPDAVATYFGTALDQPRVILEAFVPWRALGGSAAPTQLRFELGVTAFYNARWMSLGGEPPERSLNQPERWSLLSLEPSGRRRGAAGVTGSSTAGASPSRTAR